jgi:hypothetical protein
VLSTDDVQAYSDQPSPSPFPFLFLLTMLVVITYNSVTLLRLHFLQLATTRSPAPTSQLHLQQRHLAQAAFPSACNNKVACSYITTSPTTVSPCSGCISSSLQQQGRLLQHHNFTYNSVTLLRMHFLRLATTRSPALTSHHHLLFISHNLHFILPIATAPGSTKWLSISHFAWHNLAALPITIPHRYGPWFHKVAEHFTLCLAQPGRPPHTRSPSLRPLVPQSG